MVQEKASRISLSQWYELSADKKELVREWAVKHNVGLEIIPSESAETCDYAALLTTDQLKLFIKEVRANERSSETEENNDHIFLWNEIKKLL